MQLKSACYLNHMHVAIAKASHLLFNRTSVLPLVAMIYLSTE